VPANRDRELVDLFATFVAQHRGLRLGKMFGAPAIYAGRKLSACLMDDGVVMKLPPSLGERARALGGRPWAPKAGPTKGRTMNGWVIVVPTSTADANRLLPLLEAAALHAATSATTA
jgi:hypothetical protein